MAYINIFVDNDAHISVKNKQLWLKNAEKEMDWPLEDINSIMIESLRSTISTYTLSALAQNNVIVYFCDEKHLPCAYLLPFNSHFSQIKIYAAQSQISVPLKKQLWKEIVINKIKNQNKCLVLCKKEPILQDLLKNVRSGDTSNAEAVAASKYFRHLFSSSFTREQDSNINAALNYGYAIIRGVIARSIVSHGLQPFLGIKHCSTLNNFNLADDLIEVFRPFVDLFVYQNQDVVFDKYYKAQLFNLLNANCLVDGAKYTLAYAIELYVQSYIESITKGENKLKFPNLIEIENHKYD